MKTTTKITSILLIALSIGSCRSKNLSILQERNNKALQESTDLKSRIKESKHINRILELSDSINHQYQVRIFPLDTFSFSVDSGFKGKARSIEFSGSIAQRSDASGIIADSAAKLTNEVYKQQTSSSYKEKIVAKTLKKNSFGITPFWIWIGLVILTVYGVVKFFKLSRRSEV